MRRITSFSNLFGRIPVRFAVITTCPSWLLNIADAFPAGYLFNKLYHHLIIAVGEFQTVGIFLGQDSFFIQFVSKANAATRTDSIHPEVITQLVCCDSSLN